MNSKSLILCLVLAMAISVSLVAQTGMQQPSSQQPMQQPSSQQSQQSMQQPSGMQASGSDEQQIRALEEQSRQAAVRNDPSFLEQHAADDFVGITGMGEAKSKNQMVQDLRSGRIRYQSIDTRNISIRTYGNTAIVNGEATISLTRNGQPVSGNYRYTRVWVKQGGDWKIASFESTPEQPQAK